MPLLLKPKAPFQEVGYLKRKPTSYELLTTSYYSYLNASAG
jgi:hypothetical protein